MKEADKENIEKIKTVYEVGYLLDSAVSEDELGAIISSIKEVIEKKDVKFVSEAWPKKMELQYTIVVSRDGNKNTFDSAYFGWVKYEINTSDIKDIKEALEKNTSIIRFLIIKTSKEDITPFKPKERQPKIEKKDKKPIPISKEELDKTIEDLVIE